MDNMITAQACTDGRYRVNYPDATFLIMDSHDELVQKYSILGVTESGFLTFVVEERRYD